MDKKGQVPTLYWMFIIAVTIAVIAICIPIFGKFLSSVNEAISANDAIPPEGKTAVALANSNYATLWDRGFLFLFVGCWIALLIGFFFVNEHPVMAIPLIIFIWLLLLLAPMLSNMFQKFAESGVVSAGDYPITQFMMNNYLVMLIVVGFSCLGVLYAKGRYG